MCGIFYAFGNYYKDSELKSQGELIKHRGPDDLSVLKTGQHYFMFHRLKINDLSDNGNQPFSIDDCVLICNGEIYNSTQLNNTYGFRTKSKSDCETIIHAYRRFGIQWTIDNLDGVFAFVLYDKRNDVVYIGRDRIGVRSLYYGYSQTSIGFYVSSEMKSLHGMCDKIFPFPPGNYGKLTDIIISNVQPKFTLTRYHHYDYPEMKVDVDEEDLYGMIRYYLRSAVKKRLMSDRPIGCFLSGGLDSSLITALVAEHYPPNKLETFSVGLKDSPDLLYARKVAEHLQTKHHEIIVTEEDMIKAIPAVISHIESYDTTTVRASTPMFLMSKYVKENTDVTVVYSGEGSDEASGSYLYFHNAPDDISFTCEAKRLVSDLHRFDVLRCDKTTAAHSLEVRVPFLDKEFMKFYMSIPAKFKKVRPMENGKMMEKYILRKAFDVKYRGRDILPSDVLWRTKEALSDGVSKVNRSWHEIINEFLDGQELETIQCHHNPYSHKDQHYFRQVFEFFYKDRGELIPYYWLPKWCGDNNNESSARNLGVYKDLE